LCAAGGNDPTLRDCGRVRSALEPKRPKRNSAETDCDASDVLEELAPCALALTGGTSEIMKLAFHRQYVAISGRRRKACSGM